jgi:hypothetical protein
LGPVPSGEPFDGVCRDPDVLRRAAAVFLGARQVVQRAENDHSNRSACKCGSHLSIVAGFELRRVWPYRAVGADRPGRLQRLFVVEEQYLRIQADGELARGTVGQKLQPLAPYQFSNFAVDRLGLALQSGAPLRQLYKVLTLLPQRGLFYAYQRCRAGLNTRRVPMKGFRFASYA